eukprot:XP_017177352.1 PREDICTED: uncharacterized protein LOC108169150 [Mus musculus]
MNTMSRALRKPQSVFIQASTLSSPIHDFLSELRGFWGTDSLLHCHSFLQCCQRCSGVSLTPAILDGFCLSFQNCEMGADGCSCLRLLKKTPGLELTCCHKPPEAGAGSGPYSGRGLLGDSPIPTDHRPSGTLRNSVLDSLLSWRLRCGKRRTENGQENSWSWVRIYMRGWKAEAPYALPVYCPGLSLLGSSSVCLLQSTLRGNCTGSAVNLECMSHLISAGCER